MNDWHDPEENLAPAPNKMTMPRCDIEELKQEKEKLLKLYDKQTTKLQIAINSLEDIGYCKSWTYQNRPFDLVKNALDALQKIREINNGNN